MHRRNRGGGRHGRHDAAAQPAGCRLHAGGGRCARRGSGNTRGPHGGRCACLCQEGPGWIVGKLGGHHRAALPRSRGPVSSEAAHGRSVKLALPARAKLNLDLAVLNRRADGMHELRTHMESIDLHDLLEAETADETSLSVTGIDVPAAAANTVLLAQAALENTVGRPLPAKFTLHKRIPPGSGLGGASSDAAATLRALKAMHALDIDLRPIARELGSDVPFFLHGGRAHADGRGERLTQLSDEPAWFALAWPGIEL